MRNIMTKHVYYYILNLLICFIIFLSFMSVHYINASWKINNCGTKYFVLSFRAFNVHHTLHIDKLFLIIFIKFKYKLFIQLKVFIRIDAQYSINKSLNRYCSSISFVCKYSSDSLKVFFYYALAKQQKLLVIFAFWQSFYIFQKNAIVTETLICVFMKKSFSLFHNFQQTFSNQVTSLLMNI